MTAGGPDAPAAGAVDGRPDALRRYYRFHSRIYDATRWCFLFGRRRLVDAVARLAGPAPRRVLEVGCGTGRNLAALARRLPEAELTGLDLSDEMLDVARRKLAGFDERVRLVRRAYDRPLDPGAFDVVVFSYCLTMINPGWEAAVDAAAGDLAPDGRIAVADFHATPLGLFRRWMKINHVRMDAHLLPRLQARFTPERTETPRAYAGLWRWLLFVGRKRSQDP